MGDRMGVGPVCFATRPDKCFSLQISKGSKDKRVKVLKYSSFRCFEKWPS